MHIKNINNFRREVLELGSYRYNGDNISFNDIDDFSNRIKLMTDVKDCFWYSNEKHLIRLENLLKSLPKDGSLYGEFENIEKISNVEFSFFKNGITYHVFKRKMKGILIVPIENEPTPRNSITLK